MYCLYIEFSEDTILIIFYYPGISICLGVIPNELDEPGKSFFPFVVWQSVWVSTCFSFQVNIPWAERSAIKAVGEKFSVNKVV